MITAGTITALNANLNTGLPTLGSAVKVTGQSGDTLATVQIGNTWTGTLIAQISNNETDWVTITKIVKATDQSVAANFPSAATGIFYFFTGGCPFIRVTASDVITGHADVSLRSSAAIGLDPASFSISDKLPALHSGSTPVFIEGGLALSQPTATSEYLAARAGTSGGASYSLGDLISNTVVIDQSTLPATRTSYWFNVTTGTSFTSSPTISDLTPASADLQASLGLPSDAPVVDSSSSASLIGKVGGALLTLGKPTDSEATTDTGNDSLQARSKRAAATLTAIATAIAATNTALSTLNSTAATAGNQATAITALSAILSGQATATNQATAITALSAILSGQATATNQGTINTNLVSIGNVVATAAKQDTAQTSLSAIQTSAAASATAGNQATEITALNSINTNVGATATNTTPTAQTATATLTAATGGEGVSQHTVAKGSFNAATFSLSYTGTPQLFIGNAANTSTTLLGLSTATGNTHTDNTLTLSSGVWASNLDGSTVTGSGIQAGTTVSSGSGTGTLTLSQATTGTATVALTFTGTKWPAGINGQTLSGLDIPANTTVVSGAGTNSLTISNPASGTATGLTFVIAPTAAAVTFYGSTDGGTTYPTQLTMTRQSSGTSITTVNYNDTVYRDFEAYTHIKAVIASISSGSVVSKWTLSGNIYTQFATALTDLSQLMQMNYQQTQYLAALLNNSPASVPQKGFANLSVVGTTEGVGVCTVATGHASTISFNFYADTSSSPSVSFHGSFDGGRTFPATLAGQQFGVGSTSVPISAVTGTASVEFSAANYTHIQASLDSITSGNLVVEWTLGETKLVKAAGLGDQADAAASTDSATASLIGVSKRTNGNLTLLNLLMSPNNGSGTISAANSNLASGTATANSTVAISGISNSSQVAIQTVGTWVGTLQGQTCIDGTNWVNIGETLAQTGGVIHSSSGAITSASQGIYYMYTGGAPNFRVTASAWTSGSVAVTIVASKAPPLYTVPNMGLFNVNTYDFVTNSASLCPSNAFTAGFTAGLSVKTTAGQIYSYTARSKNASTTYLMFFDQASSSAPGTGTVPTLPPIPLTANTGVDRSNWPKPRRFVNGLYIGLSSTDVTFTAASTDLALDVQYL